MKFTFGIITSGFAGNSVQTVLDSINEAFLFNQKGFEVIVVGGSQSYQDDNYRIIPFDESQKKSWITKKKNIITQNAIYDNIVYMHDYISLSPGWYEGFKKFGNDFDICMTPIKNADGTRYRDWTLWPDDIQHIIGNWDGKYLLPYDVTDLSKYMYFSGPYWIAKKEIMRRFPLNETLSWGESEDVEFSKRIRQKHIFSINPHSQVRLLKQKDRIFNDASQERIVKLRSIQNKLDHSI